MVGVWLNSLRSCTLPSRLQAVNRSSVSITQHFAPVHAAMVLQAFVRNTTPPTSPLSFWTRTVTTLRQFIVVGSGPNECLHGC